MTQATTGKRVLKVGLVQDGKLIEELQLKAKAPVHIGLDPENTFVIGSGDWPKHHVLLEPVGDQYQLHVLPNMRGKVSLEEKIVELEEIESFSGAVKKGKGWSVKLTPNAKGKVIAGDTTVLFQLVAPTTQAAPMKLPRELRGGFVRSFDLHFLLIVILSLIAHILTIHYVNLIEGRDQEGYAEPPPVEVVEISIDETALEPEKPEPAEEQGDEPGKGGGERGSKKPGPKGPNEQGLLAIITQAGHGSVADLFSDGSIGDDIIGAIDDIGGVKVARSGDIGTRGGLGGGGDGSTVGIDGLGGVAKDANLDMGQKGVRKVKGSIQSGNYQAQGKLSPKLIAERVARYLGGIKACYERVLKQDPTLAGKVTVRFTIGTDGKVTAASIVASTLSDESVKQCILRRIRRWTFPKPEEGTVTVSYPFIFTAVK